MIPANPPYKIPIVKEINAVEIPIKSEYPVPYKILVNISLPSESVQKMNLQLGATFILE